MSDDSYKKMISIVRTDFLFSEYFLLYSYWRSRTSSCRNSAPWKVCLDKRLVGLRSSTFSYSTYFFRSNSDVTCHNVKWFVVKRRGKKLTNCLASLCSDLFQVKWKMCPSFSMFPYWHLALMAKSFASRLTSWKELSWFLSRIKVCSF